MSTDGLAMDQSAIHGTDTNSLLRLHDRAKEVVARAQSQLERNRAEQAIRRIEKELVKRKVSM
jgi:hypothetical protein